jgi:hypothetical protein
MQNQAGNQNDNQPRTVNGKPAEVTYGVPKEGRPVNNGAGVTVQDAVVKVRHAFSAENQGNVMERT